MSMIKPEPIGQRLYNYKLSSSYPTMRPLTSSDNWKSGLSYRKWNFTNHLTKSWGNYGSKLSSNDMSSDLTSLSWLEKRSIINIDPLDYEDDNDSSDTPGEQDLVNTNLSHAKVEVGSQENVHDFVRYAEMRNNAKYRPNGNVYDQPFQHSANGYMKPNLSYTQLIFLAIETCSDRAMTVNDIYQWCEINYPYYKYIGPSWKNSLRHNLSINKSFKRMPRDGQSGGGNGGGNRCYDGAFSSSGDELIDTGPPSNLNNSTKQLSSSCSASLVTNNNKGGPGRGAYWIVDDKERATLLESIYRTHQQQYQQNNAQNNNTNNTTLPVLSDRSNGGVNTSVTTPTTTTLTTNKPTSISSITPELALLLRAAGLTTATNSNINSRDLPQLITDHNGTTTLATLLKIPTSTDENNTASNYKTIQDSNTGLGAETDITLSASYNSTFSKLDGYCPSADSPVRNDGLDNETSLPKIKNRRKSKHEKIRSIAEIERLLHRKSSNGGSNRHTSADYQESYSSDNNLSECGSLQQSADELSVNNNNNNTTSTTATTSNNKSSNTTTTVNVIVAPHFDHLYARYQHFLPPAIPSDMDKKAYRNQKKSHFYNLTQATQDYSDDEENFEENENDGGDSLDGDFLKRNKRNMSDEEDDDDEDDPLCDSGITVKTEKLDPSEQLQLSGRSASGTLLSLVAVEKTEPITEQLAGYESDATLPMITPSVTTTTAIATTTTTIDVSNQDVRKRRRKPIKTTKLGQHFVSNKSVINKDDTPSSLLSNRPKRKRFRATRIDESSELEAVNFLASLHTRHPSSISVNKLDNLYRFLDDIHHTTTTNTITSITSNVKTTTNSSTTSYYNIPPSDVNKKLSSNSKHITTTI